VRLVNALVFAYEFSETCTTPSFDRDDEENLQLQPHLIIGRKFYICPGDARYAHPVNPFEIQFSRLLPKTSRLVT